MSHPSRPLQPTQSPPDAQTWATTELPLVSALRSEGARFLHFRPVPNTMSLYEAIFVDDDVLQGALDKRRAGELDTVVALLNLHDETHRLLKDARRSGGR